MMTKNGKITWTNERRKLSDLIPWDINPATISKDAAKRLEESLDEFGQVETIAISPNNEIYDGHQRQVVWGASAKFGADYVVDVRVSSRELTERERKKLVIFLRKGTVGEIDFDVLANNWELDDLLEWGFDKKELDIDLWGENDNDYSRNIQAPIYTPKGIKPNIKELFDDTKTKILLDEIDKSNLPEDEKEFLRIAARRHTVLNYKNIAEYYAHSEKATQELFENSALIIIDFRKAIELGYVKLSEEIAKQYLEDYHA